MSRQFMSSSMLLHISKLSKSDSLMLVNIFETRPGQMRLLTPLFYRMSPHKYIPMNEPT